MNRRDRRRAAAQARAGRPTGYMHRLLACQDQIAAIGRGKVVQLVCHHDPWCAIYTSRRECDCVPQMSAHLDGTDTVLEIDEQGRASKRQSS